MHMPAHRNYWGPWFFLFCLVLVLCQFSRLASAATHTATIRNKTRKAANDLHLVFHHKTGNPSTPSFTNAPTTGDGGFTYDFSGGSVASPGSATVTWDTSFTPDSIDEGYWTMNGTNIGNIDSMTVALLYDTKPDGSGLIAIDNQAGTPVAFSNLQIFTGADQSFFSAGSYVDFMFTGQPVESFVGPSGTFPPGRTLISSFPASLAGYTAVALQVDGDLFALGSSPFPRFSPPIISGSQLQVEIGGDPGRIYEVQGSADLQKWDALQKGMVTTEPVVFVDNISNARFYRAVLSSATNRPPTVSAISATFANRTTTYVVTASDPEGDPLTFTWSKSNPCGDFTPGGTTAAWFHPHPPCPEEEFHPGIVTLDVSDGHWIIRVLYPFGSLPGQKGPPPMAPVSIRTVL